MKHPSAVNTERQAAEVIEKFLDHIPHVRIEGIDREDDRSSHDGGVDLIVTARFGEKHLLIVVEVKPNGQPRTARHAAQSLHRYRRMQGADVIPVFMAPYLSPQAREVCREEQIGYLDFVGNALIAFETVYIERAVADQPMPERRAIRSLYKPKSARILRRLLAEPGRHWRTAELAEAAKVSVGLISQVSKKLREHSWAEQVEQGLALIDPNALLDSWAENYEPPGGEVYRCYTTLHGKAVADKLHGLMFSDGRAALASYSAAEWLAPYARHPNTYIYADQRGYEGISELLDLREAKRGHNVVITVPDEDGVLDDACSTADGVSTTSPVQTYLDLMHAGDRGKESAEHLRSERLNWTS